MTKSFVAALLVVGMAAGSVVALTVTAVGAQQSSPCPPGQPPGRPPGVPPGPPSNVPPSGRGQYPPGECNLKVSQSAATRGEQVGVSGGGFVPGEVVALSLDPGAHVLGSLTADASGGIAGSITVPSAASLGDNRVLASSASRQLAASLQVVEAAPAAAAPAAERGRSAGSSLARTGATIAGTALVGVSLVLIGLAVVGATRRKVRRVA